MSRLPGESLGETPRRALGNDPPGRRVFPETDYSVSQFDGIFPLVDPRPDPFQYTDPQAYLRDWFNAQRQSLGRRGSLQAVATRLGLASKSHLHRALNDPALPISRDLVRRLANLIGLDSNRADFLDAMVLRRRATSLTERTRQHERMRSLLPHKLQKSEKRFDTYAYFGDWRLPVLRELASLPGFRGDWDALGRRMVPALSAARCRKAVKGLCEMGFLEALPDGGYRQVDPYLQSDPDGADLSILKFQDTMIERARFALDTMSAEQREISSLTFSMPQAMLPRLRQKMRRFQEELVREILAAQSGDMDVFQFNLQMFPVTRGGSEKEGEPCAVEARAP